MPHRDQLIDDIRKRRLNQNLGQRELSRKLRKAEDYIARLESGRAKHLDVEDYIGIGKALNFRAWHQIKIVEERMGNGRRSHNPHPR